MLCRAVPCCTCRCVVVLCFILGLPMLHSYVAFAAITSIGVVGLYSSYLVRAASFQAARNRIDTVCLGCCNDSFLNARCPAILCSWSAAAGICALHYSGIPAGKACPSCSALPVTHKLLLCPWCDEMCGQICIGLRLLASEENFQRGPFHLGRWSKLVAGIAFAWACIAVIMFVLPQVYPVTAAVSAAAASVRCTLCDKPAGWPSCLCCHVCRQSLALLQCVWQQE